MKREYVANVAQTAVSDEDVATFISGLESYYECRGGSIYIQGQQEQNSGKNRLVSNFFGSK